MKKFRIIILLLILVFSAFYTKIQRLESTSWAKTLPILIYPINADGQLLTDNYISTLGANDFKNVEVFFQREWRHYSDLDRVPVEVFLMPVIDRQPPSAPSSSNILVIALWSLRLRIWSYRYASGSTQQSVNLFIRYHQMDENKRLAHSLGLQKGLIGVVNGYAGQAYREKNNIVLAHEVLHTIGATDKYNLQTGQPIFPDGFAIPKHKYQQTKAEVMAVKIPLSLTEAIMPDSLKGVVLGPKTAKEIGWLNE